jgi:hypothetical protein
VYSYHQTIPYVDIIIIIIILLFFIVKVFPTLFSFCKAKYERTAKWQEIEAFVNEGGIDLMLKLIEYSNMSYRFNSRSQHLNEMAQFALNILHVVSTVNFGQNAILNAQLEQKTGTILLPVSFIYYTYVYRVA